MGKSIKQRSFTKKEIDQKWQEVLEAARQYATCHDKDEHLQLNEMQLRLFFKQYLKMIPPFVSKSEVVFWIVSYTCDPAFEPLSEDLKQRLRKILDQIVLEKRNWGHIDRLKKSVKMYQKRLQLINQESEA